MLCFFARSVRPGGSFNQLYGNLLNGDLFREISHLKKIFLGGFILKSLLNSQVAKIAELPCTLHPAYKARVDSQNPETDIGTRSYGFHQFLHAFAVWMHAIPRKFSTFTVMMRKAPSPQRSLLVLIPLWSYATHPHPSPPASTDLFSIRYIFIAFFLKAPNNVCDN